MSLRSLVRSLGRNRRRRSRSTVRRTALGLEALEERQLLSCNTISGMVFQDSNNNGLYDLGELPIANNPIVLRNSSEVIVGAATTDGQGHYEFASDSTIDTTVTSQSVNVLFPTSPTNSTQVRQIAQFDPALGELLSVEIVVVGSITSDIRVENQDPSPVTITSTVAGDLRLSGPHFDLLVTTSPDAQSFQAAAYDGATDFAGTSGRSLGARTATGTQAQSLSGAGSLTDYIGTGLVTFTEVAQATSAATGGGNMVAALSSSGSAQVTVTYRYRPSNCLRSGTYTIIQTTQPTGFLDGRESHGGNVVQGSVGADTIVVSLSDADLTGNDFGETAPASLAGLVYLDANNDGIKNATETGISGVGVALTGTDDLGHAVHLTQATATSGSYGFAGLRPGNYAITETHPSAYLDGKDTLGSAAGSLVNDGFSAIVLLPGTAGADYNFGELLPASLAGVVYLDGDNNGVKAATETGIASVRVNLFGTDDLGRPVSLTQNTQADGAYRFTGLRPGNYSLAESQPNGYFDGKDALGTTGGVLGNDQASIITLGSASAGVDYNFGELLPASLAGFIYLDADNSGTRAAGEIGLAGVPIRLTGTDDLGQSVDLTQSTLVDGSFGFTGLRPGRYALHETQPAAYLDGKDAIGTVGGTLADDRATSIDLAPGASGTNYNFGELPAASLAGWVYMDANDNGLKEAGEIGLGVVVVSLTGTDDRGNAVSLVQPTAPDGSYRFLGLRPGAYTLTETHPAAFLDGRDTLGSMGGIAGDDQFANILLGVGLDGTEYNFGERPSASLGGWVFLDANNNGFIDVGEPGIVGVLIYLQGSTGGGDSISLTQTSGPDGSFEFASLAAGEYSLIEEQPGAYLDGKDALGTAGGTIANDHASNITLVNGVAGRNYNFGELLPASIAGFVYVDGDNDGLRELGEPGIAGVSVTLAGTDDLGSTINLSQITALDGSYQFANLRPGNYSLREIQPGGYFDGKDTLGSIGGVRADDWLNNIVLGQGFVGRDYDFGELLPGSLSGRVYVDRNNNCIPEDGEPVIPTVRLTLTGVDDLGNPVSITKTTGVDGTYTFTGLRPGTYTVIETQPDGFLDGTPTPGSTGGVPAGDRLANIPLQSGQVSANNNFCELAPARVSGFVYMDVNNNGVWDRRERPIGGVSITLTGTDDRGNNVALTVPTAADGSYLFSGLRPGTYAITETQPLAYRDGKETLGNLGGTVQDDKFTGIVLPQGAHAKDYNFGELRGGRSKRQFLGRR